MHYAVTAGIPAPARVGHGHSDGERVHVENIDTYVQDVINHVELMKSKYPPHLPYILMGHSMGGLIAAHATILRGDMFAGLVLSAAASGHECCDCCYSEFWG
jgi:acylglycerol lipase